MRPKIYEVLRMAVEAGVRIGWRRAHKHVDSPSEEATIQEVEEAVMSEISEWFSFEDLEDRS